jgi:tetratricopeptide (TPR) repeat protein
LNANRLNRNFRSEPLVLVALFILATLSFTAVSALSNSYRARQRGITRQLYARASAEMKAGNHQGAARSFRAALDLAPDNFSSQLGLAEALMAGQRDREALAYLQILWEREPENGRVNLELARVYAGRGDRDRAIRHYQNAIYAVWEADTDGNRRAVGLNSFIIFSAIAQRIRPRRTSLPWPETFPKILLSAIRWRHSFCRLGATRAHLPSTRGSSESIPRIARLLRAQGAPPFWVDNM